MTVSNDINPQLCQNPQQSIERFYKAISCVSLYRKINRFLHSCFGYESTPPPCLALVMIFITSAILSVILALLLLPVKLALLFGLFFCKSRQVTGEHFALEIRPRRPLLPPQEPEAHTYPADDDTSSDSNAPLLLPERIPSPAPSVSDEAPRELTLREYISLYYPDDLSLDRIDVEAIARGILEGTDIPADLSAILNLPASLFYSGDPNNLELPLLPLPGLQEAETEEEESFLPNDEIEELDVSDPRYQFLQHYLPGLSREDYIKFLPIAGEIMHNLDIPYSESLAPTEIGPEAQPISYPASPQQEEGATAAETVEGATTELLEGIDNENPEEWSKQFSDLIIRQAPSDWSFLSKLQAYIRLLTSRNQYEPLIKATIKLSDPPMGSPLKDINIQTTSRAYLGFLTSLLSQRSLPVSLKTEIINNICQQSSKWVITSELLLPLLYDEMFALFVLQKEHAIAALSEDAQAYSEEVQRLFPPVSSNITEAEVAEYLALLQKKFSQPLVTRPDSLPLSPSTNVLLQALTVQYPPWSEFKHEFIQTVRNICGTSNRAIEEKMLYIINRLASEMDQLVAHTNEAAASSRASMYLLYQLLLRTDISLEKKRHVLRSITCYADRCAPTWITETNNQLASYMNESTQGRDLLISWVQDFKNSIIYDLYENQPEWHAEVAFKLKYQEPLGLDPGFIDRYTDELTTHLETLEYYYGLFMQRYSESAADMVDFIYNQSHQSSAERVNTLMDIVLDDIAQVVPSSVISDIMECFFPENENYMPSKMAIIYLLLREGILDFQ